MQNSKDNIKFEYMFRDEGNYKIFQGVTLLNPEKIDIVTFEKKLKSKLIDGEFFYPTEWGLPFQTFGEDPTTQWAEFLNVCYSNDVNTIELSAYSLLESII